MPTPLLNILRIPDKILGQYFNVFTTVWLLLIFSLTFYSVFSLEEVEILQENMRGIGGWHWINIICELKKKKLPLVLKMQVYFNNAVWNDFLKERKSKPKK